jgi:L-rhamnose mutarotase
MRRVGQVIGLRPENISTYEELHALVWPDVLATIARCNMRNYSIFRYGTLLFAYFEYVGDDYAADMARMAADPTTQQWWSLTEPMQQPVPEHRAEEWWHELPEVFHVD